MLSQNQIGIITNSFSQLTTNTNFVEIVNINFSVTANNNFNYNGRNIKALTNIYSGRRVLLFQDTNTRQYYAVGEDFNPVLSERTFTRKYVAPKPTRKHKLGPVPPGNWVVLFDYTWHYNSAGIAFAKALLKFIGAHVAGKVFLDTYSQSTFAQAARELGIEVNNGWGSVIMGSLTQDYPFVVGSLPYNFPSYPMTPLSLSRVRDRIARWGGVVMTDSSPASANGLLVSQQCATPEAIAGGYAGGGVLVDYYDTDTFDLEQTLIDQPDSPFTPDEVGVPYFNSNRPRLTRDSVPVIIPDTDMKQFFPDVDPFAESKWKSKISPKPLTLITSENGTGYGGFFSRVNTSFPSKAKYERVE